MKFGVSFLFACLISHAPIDALLQRSTTARYHYRAHDAILQSETIL